MNPRIFQLLIALDQTANTAVSLFIGGGWADETLSARCWRQGEIEGVQGWKRAQRIVDTIMRSPTHCRDSFTHCRQRAYSPPEER